MKKKKILMEVLGKELEGYGFSYDKEDSTQIDWYFTREKDSIKQKIWVGDHRFDSALMLRFDTTAWGVNMVDAGHIISKKEPYYSVWGDWSYHNEDEFREVLNIFVDIIEKYGLAKLEEMSVEEEVIPTTEMGNLLFSSYENLSLKFAQDYNLSTAGMIRENAIQWFSVLQGIFEETEDEPYENMKEVLVEITAFLGEQLRKEVGGDWMQKEDHRLTYLTQLDCYIISMCPILTYVVESWKKQNLERLKQEYLYMLDAKMPLEISEMEKLQERRREINNNPF